jgi:SPP1 family phage portal protein
MKIVNAPTTETDKNGEPVYKLTLVDVARVGIPFQELIVNRRVGFMLSDPVTTDILFSKDTEEEKALLEMVDRIQNDNKCDYKNKELARRMMSEMECAEIWYFVPNTDPDIKGQYTLRMKVLSPDLGDRLWPLFDEVGDLIAFAREYKLRNIDGVDINHYDIYTKDLEYKWIQRDTKWILDDQLNPNINPIPNPVGKIMIIYYTQPQPEWAKVQSMIERFEMVISNHADTNDYFGNPILTVSGKVQGFAAKGEQGKILELENGAQANYLALSSEPASVKMEQENLERFIYTMSQTPNITFSEMKGMGAISGIALKLLFLDAHMAVKSKEEIFGTGLQRRLNLLKAAIGKIVDTSLKAASLQVQLKPVITPYLPMNETEVISNLSIALTSGIISQESAVEQNPYVADSESEMERITGEADKQAQQESKLASLMQKNSIDNANQTQNNNGQNSNLNTQQN